MLKKPMKLNYEALIWLGVFRCDEFSSKWIKMTIKIFAFGVFTGNLVVLLCSYGFFIISDNLEDNLLALYQLSAISNTSYTLMVAFVLKSDITNIFTKLANIQNFSELNTHFDKILKRSTILKFNV